MGAGIFRHPETFRGRGGSISGLRLIYPGWPVLALAIHDEAIFSAGRDAHELLDQMAKIRELKKQKARLRASYKTLINKDILVGVRGFEPPASTSRT